MTQRTSTLIAPSGRWWSPLGREERMWFTVTLVWALAMFAMMQLVWPAVGEQQATFQSYRVDPAEFQALTDAFVQANQAGEQFGIPVVAPPPGDVYLVAQQFQFRPIVRLKQGETYRFLISSKDVQHGLSIQPHNVNFQVLPGFVIAVRMTPKETGTFHIVCNEFCGGGHHTMIGRLEVEP